MKPTYNHSREDSPMYPCPECARSMSRAGLLNAYLEMRRLNRGQAGRIEALETENSRLADRLNDWG